MTECTNIDIRDILPEFIHGTLDGSASERVRAHLEGCSACTEEVQLLRSIRFLAVTLRVDVARIAAAIPPYRRRRSFWSAAIRPMSLAAAALVCAVGLSTVAITHYHHTTQPAPSAATAAAPSAGIAIVGVSELSDDHLEQLISQMDQLEAAPPVDPEPALPPEVDNGV